MSDVQRFPKERFVLDCRGRLLDCRPGRADGVQVMGILNVTPDSFSDGGLYTEIDDAVRHAGRMLAEGARIIDVGGESSRPAGSTYGEGADAVPKDEELARVLPVIEGIADAHPEAIISVDTYKAAVARQALEAGAHLINDITALRYDPALANVCAEAGAPLVLMHSVGEPGAMVHEMTTEDVAGAVRKELHRAVKTAREAGVEQLILDPGFGFGKTARDNLTLLAACDELLREQHPVMIGVSRKSTIGSVLGSSEEPAPIMERLFGSLGATAAAVVRGATVVRTHDVQPTVEMLRLLTATLATREGSFISFAADSAQFSH